MIAINMIYRIKELRARDNLTQSELAREVGVRWETKVFLEIGKYNLSLKLAYDIAQEFGVTIEEVFVFQPLNQRLSSLSFSEI